MIVVEWKLPPTPIAISDHEIHVWRQSLDLTPEVVDDYKKYLNEHELQQGQRFLQPEHQRRYWVSKAALKKILARYLHLSPLDIEFTKGEHGKPFLKPNHYPFNIYFNMSHSEEVGVYAIAKNEKIGIDIEFLEKKGISFIEIAKRFFAKSEYEELLDMPADQRYLGFYLAWTRKEAYVKAIGKGLSYSLQRFEVSLDPNQNNALLKVEGGQENTTEWLLASAMVEKNYLLAIAMQGKPQHIEFYYSLP